MRLKKIISGGQTGADMGGLKAAKELGLETGGTAPRNYMTEDGPNHSLKEYGLSEFGTYAIRTHRNIRDSDGTVLFGKSYTPGSNITLKFCWYLKKPVIMNPGVLAFFKFITDYNIETLNVAGNRESYSPGIEEKVRQYLVTALREGNE